MASSGMIPESTGAAVSRWYEAVVRRASTNHAVNGTACELELLDAVVAAARPDYAAETARAVLALADIHVSAGEGDVMSSIAASAHLLASELYLLLNGRGEEEARENRRLALQYAVHDQRFRKEAYEPTCQRLVRHLLAEEDKEQDNGRRVHLLHYAGQFAFVCDPALSESLLWRCVTLSSWGDWKDAFLQLTSLALNRGHTETARLFARLSWNPAAIDAAESAADAKDGPGSPAPWQQRLAQSAIMSLARLDPGESHSVEVFMRVAGKLQNSGLGELALLLSHGVLDLRDDRDLPDDVFRECLGMRARMGISDATAQTPFDNVSLSEPFMVLAARAAGAEIPAPRTAVEALEFVREFETKRPTAGWLERAAVHAWAGRALEAPVLDAAERDGQVPAAESQLSALLLSVAAAELTDIGAPVFAPELWRDAARLSILLRGDSSFPFALRALELSTEMRIRNADFIARRSMAARMLHLRGVVGRAAALSASREDARDAARAWERDQQDQLAVQLTSLASPREVIAEAESKSMAINSLDGAVDTQALLGLSRPTEGRWLKAERQTMLDDLPSSIRPLYARELQLPSVPDGCDVLFFTLHLGGAAVGLWGCDGDRWEAFFCPFDRGEELVRRHAPGEAPFALKRRINARHPMQQLAETLPLQLRRKVAAGRCRRLIICVQAESAAVPWAALPLMDGTPLVRAVPPVVAPSLTIWTALRSRPRPVGSDIVHDVFGTIDGQDAASVRRALGSRDVRNVVVVGHGNNEGWTNHAVELGDGSTLTAAELLSTRLTGTLWLGSCWSAVPSPEVGCEPLGLATAALLAGARSTVGSSWPLPIHSVAEITGAALPDLMDGIEAADALARAQVSYLDAHPDAAPWEWATLTATGP